MDVKTAQHVVMTQADLAQTDSFLARLQQHHPPIPGQVTSLLLALKVITEDLKAAIQLDRALAYALHQLAYESRRAYERGKQARVEWPPLLDDDIERIAIAIAQIFKGGA
ncbi:MAG: Dethiobiotin synthetase [Cyanobacteria bacterium P01_F01_bin.13]